MPTITEAVREVWTQLPNAEIVTDAETETRVLLLAVDAIRARLSLDRILAADSTLYAEWNSARPELTHLADQLTDAALLRLDSSDAASDSNVKQLDSHVAA